MENWDEVASSAEARQDWDTAIYAVSTYAECYSPDHTRHRAHLWHMDLLAQAGRLDELAALGGTDKHARRKLDRFLYENGRDSDLRLRARNGDKSALYYLLRLLRQRGEHAAAEQAAADIDADNEYARHIATRPMTGN
ncbi:hypothetical protein [Nocardia sp. NPDC019395]|uniref:hypothetical protein n=1 Tax=Nocardia sp. NPDC019395 TaxID=3154686 RepID=UPI0033E1D805